MIPKQIVEKLASFSHRGTATQNEKPVLDFLIQLFDNQSVTKKSFKTPKTYVSVVYWLIGGLVAGLILLHYFPFWGLVLVFLFVTMALLYFNWYASPITKFPPLATSHNLVIQSKKIKPNLPKLILMAHWDTAPISFLYKSSMVGNFRSSMKMSLILMVFAEFIAIFHFFSANIFTQYMAIGLIIYFIMQGITGTIDFFRFGYSNGASDNATGVAAAIETAKRLWAKDLENLEIELVLTSAEEAGMLGARAYFIENQSNFTKETYLINFDTLGSGDLKIITQTGTWSNIIYDNHLIKKAKEVIAQSADFQGVTTGSWHTADFDSVWFQRAGIPSVTLAALDKDGKMPNIHRPTDTLENVDFKPMIQAIDLAEKIALNLFSN